MSKRTIFTTVTPLPAGITRETVLSTLHNHVEMIDLNPLVTERHPIKAPSEATAEEYYATWYSVTDKINYLPKGMYSGAVTFNACFHDLPDGLQTRILAPMGLNIKGRWTLGGTLPGELRQPVELGLGVPKTGLWLREDVDMKVNFMMTKFVKGNTKKAHSTLVARLIEKAHLVEAQVHNSGLAEQLSLREQYPPDYHTGVQSPCAPTPQRQSQQGGSQLFDGKPLNVSRVSSLGMTSPGMQQRTFSIPQSPPPGHPAMSNQSNYFQPPGSPDPRFSYGGQPPYPTSHAPPAPYGGGDTKYEYQDPARLDTNAGAVEMSSQDARTPVELANSNH